MSTNRQHVQRAYSAVHFKTRAVIYSQRNSGRNVFVDGIHTGRKQVFTTLRPSQVVARCQMRPHTNEENCLYFSVFNPNKGGGGS